MDASYTSTPVPFVQMMGTGAQPLDGSASNSPALQQRGFFDIYNKVSEKIPAPL
jgi:hypothetical protein